MIKMGIYEHYSGKKYQIIGLAKHSETLEDMVVYQALYDAFGLWVRPAKMFFENIDQNGKTIPRFKWISAGMTKMEATLHNT